MEIFILKRNNDISFKNEVPYIYKEVLKNEEYGNFKELDSTKCKIDLLDKTSEINRDSACKYLHVYELVKVICKKQVISRAYFKLYEMIYHEPIIYRSNFSSLFICEAPGGFIECISDIRRKKNLQTKFLSVSKLDTSIKFNPYIEENNLIDSDITEYFVLNELTKKVNSKFPDGLDFITADGGFEIKNYNCQENITSKLLLCEIYLAICTQKVGGMFVIKFFDMFTHNSVIYYLLLCSFYEYVKIIKPHTSRNSNSERYLICYNFKGTDKDTIMTLKTIIFNFKVGYTEVFPNVKISDYIKNRIKSFNNLIVYEQIKTINESIKMAQSKDTYLQNMLLKIFSKNKMNFDKLSLILLYKNILCSRIKLCSNFLRNYNINIHHILF